MNGPYPFTSTEIDNRVLINSIGNYALGKLDNEGTFIVKYVGRSDTCLNTELKQRLNKKYTHFKFSYAKTIKEAYEKECNNYHDFEEDKYLDNDIHPAKPKDTDYVCPVCQKKLIKELFGR